MFNLFCYRREIYPIFEFNLEASNINNKCGKKCFHHILCVVRNMLAITSSDLACAKRNKYYLLKHAPETNVVFVFLSLL